MATIDYVKCNGISSCKANGICIEVCAVNAVSILDGYPHIDFERCPDCGLCVMNCPNEAISLN